MRRRLLAITRTRCELVMAEREDKVLLVRVLERVVDSVARDAFNVRELSTGRDADHAGSRCGVLQTCMTPPESGAGGRRRVAVHNAEQNSSSHLNALDVKKIGEMRTRSPHFFFFFGFRLHRIEVEMSKNISACNASSSSASSSKSSSSSLSVSSPVIRVAAVLAGVFGPKRRELSCTRRRRRRW